MRFEIKVVPGKFVLIENEEDVFMSSDLEKLKEKVSEYIQLRYRETEEIFKNLKR